MNILLVGLGGALGSIMRYLTSRFFFGLDLKFPAVYATFTVNLLGGLLIGLLFGLSEKYGWMTPSVRLFLMVGVCGGFTTFSAFSLENVSLLQGGNYMASLIYIAASLILCPAATFAGILLTR